MFGREIIAIGATGAVSIFFLILIAYAAYGVVICFAEDSTFTNFKNFAISNVVLIIMGAIFFGIGLICLYLVFRAGGFVGCDKVERKMVDMGMMSEMVDMGEGGGGEGSAVPLRAAPQRPQPGLGPLPRGFFSSPLRGGGAAVGRVPVGRVPVGRVPVGRVNAGGVDEDGEWWRG